MYTGGSVGAKAAGVGAQRAHIGSGDEDEVSFSAYTST